MQVQVGDRSDNALIRIHDLKHTFGRRLRAVGVSFEDRQDLLGHCSGRITKHYSSGEVQNLYNAAKKVDERQQSGIVLTMLRTLTREVADKNNVRLVVSL